MTKLETILWELYLQGDPRISVLASFQEGPYTYVKVAVNDGKHDVTVEQIEEEVDDKDLALNITIQSAIEKAADIITARALAPVIAEFSNDPVR